MREKYIIEDSRLYVKVPAMERINDLQRQISDVQKTLIGSMNDEMMEILDKLGELYGDKTLGEIALEERAKAVKEIMKNEAD